MSTEIEIAAKICKDSHQDPCEVVQKKRMLNMITRPQAQREKHVFFLPIVVPTIGVRQICTLPHSIRSRFLPSVAGMVMIFKDLLNDSAFNRSEMCLTDTGNMMLDKDLHAPKAPSPM